MTAYEVRISDWSSDVCSSDLHLLDGVDRRCLPLRHADRRRLRLPAGAQRRPPRPGGRACAELEPLGDEAATRRFEAVLRGDELQFLLAGVQRGLQHLEDRRSGSGERSEEHTSELQSLMRISYAVFCLKKKKKYTTIQNKILH